MERALLEWQGARLVCAERRRRVVPVPATRAACATRRTPGHRNRAHDARDGELLVDVARRVGLGAAIARATYARSDSAAGMDLPVLGTATDRIAMGIAPDHCRQLRGAATRNDAGPGRRPRRCGVVD